MREGMQTLLRLLRNEPQPASVAEPEWLAVLTIAEEENLLPWIAARLVGMAGRIPDSISRSAAELRREAQREAFAWSAALKQMLAAFHERGIPVISVKGPWLAQRLYGDTALRAYSDLDFLVRPSDWAATEDLLRELGFCPARIRDERHGDWHRAGIRIEPHFRLTVPFDIVHLDSEDLWKRARLSEFHGAPGWLLSPSDELLFLCIHAARHCFERLSLLLDLKMAFRQLAPPALDGYAGREAYFHRSLALCWMLARRLESPGAHPAILPPWLSAHRRFEKIADRVWEQCMLHAGATHQRRPLPRYYLRLEASGWHRLRRCIHYIWIKLICRSDHDIAFASRLHLHRNWQVQMLRPVRLLIQASGIAPSRWNSPRQRPLFSDSIRRKPAIDASMKGRAS